VRRWLGRSETTGELSDLPRSGRPVIYSEESKLRMMAFYCQKQPLPGCGRWSLRWAVRHLEVETKTVGAAPGKSTFTMKQRLEEFEYIRNGTLDVFAFLNHADGKVSLECHADHTTDTFLAVFARHAGRLPATEPLHYVMDNLSSHRSYPFCLLVARLSGILCPKEKELCTQAKRMQWLQRDDKRVVIHFTPFHGSWLNLVEIWFGIMGGKVLTESFCSPDDLKAALEAFADTWDLLLAHPFRWSYDGKGLHEKAVKRFTAMLRISATKINLRTLTKLLMLMTNLLDGYFEKIPIETWNHLVQALSSQFETISDIILQEPRPKPKKRAQLAVTNLEIALQRRGYHLEDLAA
jgi:transposase